MLHFRSLPAARNPNLTAPRRADPRGVALAGSLPRSATPAVAPGGALGGAQAAGSS